MKRGNKKWQKGNREQRIERQKREEPGFTLGTESALCIPIIRKTMRIKVKALYVLYINIYHGYSYYLLNSPFIKIRRELGQWFFHKCQKTGQAGIIPITKMKKQRLRDAVTLFASGGIGMRIQVLSASSWVSPLCLHSS